MSTDTFRELRDRALAGDLDAGVALGEHYGNEGRVDEARKWLEPGASSGHAAAMRVLGHIFLVNPGMPVADGVRLTIEAAEKGDAQALHQLAVFAASGAGIPLDWPTAFEALRHAAARGHRLAADHSSCSPDSISRACSLSRLPGRCSSPHASSRSMDCLRTSIVTG